GLSGIVAQVVLLRELLITFLGNELTIGIILANWLILEGIGSFLIGQSVEKTSKKLEIYVLFQLIFSLSFPLAIYLCRIIKSLLLVTPGEAIGFAPIFYSSFLILLPVAILHGALFTYGCKLYSQYTEEKASSIGKVYVLETLGSIIGGIFITFILIQYLNSFQIAISVSLANTFVSILLIEKRVFPFSFKSYLWVFSIFLTSLFFYLILASAAHDIHLSSVKAQWQGLNVIHNENSIYGNITVIQKGEQFTFFTDGVPTITTPVPDFASIEDFVHFPMLFHEKPESILILSGGAGGVIQEILKYRVKNIDYVELDPLLLKLVQKFSTPLTHAEISDPKVKIHYTDGRFFIKKTSDKFDLIFIGLSSPQELQTNRLFSTEFFSIAKHKMNPDGIITLTLPGSLTYLSPELKNLNGCILSTLKSVFKHVRIIPGDTNLYLASDSNHIQKMTPKQLSERLAQRKIPTRLFNKAYIEYRLHERWLNWFLHSLEGRENYINSDFHPWAVFFSLSYWNALLSPYLLWIFKWAEGLNLKIALIIIAMITIFLSGLFAKKPSLAKYSLPYATFSSGITDMMLDLAIILTFQTLYGYLYYQIGLLITIFMVGVAFSSFYITKRLDDIQNDARVFIFMELWIIGFALLLPFVFLIPAYYLEKAVVYAFLYAAFLIMSFMCGTLVGFQFPLATKIYLKMIPREGAFGKTAGLMYGADLFGGFLGGLVGGVFLLPVLGLKDACFLMAAVKASSFSLFVLFTRIYK
ncbi:MAG: fused MFS/spermidine synthase, partial [bacterium]